MKYRIRKVREDAGFDKKHGTDTAGVTHLAGLDTLGPHQGSGVEHLASPRGEYDAAIALLDLDPTDLSFVDLGAGKGRALLYAAELPFRRLIGVEFARELYETGLRNLAVRADPRIALIHADAATYGLPEEPLLLFLFNPFGPPVIDLVAERALTSWRACPRPMRILYMNPLHLDHVAAAGWRMLRVENGAALFGPPER